MINNYKAMQSFIYIHLIFFDIQHNYQTQAVQHKYFECYFFPPTCWIIQMLPVQHRSKYILQLCYNQNAFLGNPDSLPETMCNPHVCKLGDIYKEIVHFKKKIKDFTFQQRNTWIKLWAETGRIPFVKSAMVETKKCSMIS